MARRAAVGRRLTPVCADALLPRQVKTSRTLRLSCLQGREVKYGLHEPDQLKVRAPCGQRLTPAWPECPCGAARGQGAR
jgi:hypothetical protein